jgi:hypothetical protein
LELFGPSGSAERLPTLRGYPPRKAGDLTKPAVAGFGAD